MPATSVHPTASEDRATQIAALYAAFDARLHAHTARAITTNAQNVDDACAYAWTQLLAYPHVTLPAEGWLSTVARREALRLDRAARRELACERLPAAEGVAATQGVRIDLTTGMRAIHPRRRRMTLLHAAGFSVAEIARREGTSPERARALIYKARLQLIRTTGYRAGR